jgi:hypothetical protein
MKRRALLFVAAVLALPASQAHAFWPFTRDAALVAPDTLTGPVLERRFAKWKLRTAAADSTVAATDSATVPPPAPPQSGVYKFTETPAPAPQFPPPAAAIADSTVLAAMDSVAADSTATAATTTGAGSPPQDLPAAGTPPAAVNAALAARGFAPELRVTLNSSNDALRMNSDLRSAFTDGSGISLTSNLSYAEDHSLTQSTVQETKGLTNAFSMPLRGAGLLFSLTTTNRKLDRQGARTTTGIRTNNSSDDRGAQFSMSFGRELDRTPWLRRGIAWRNATRGLRINSFYARNFNQNEQNVVAATGTGAGAREHAGEGNSYGGGIGFDRFAKWFTVKARAGRATIDNTDRSPSFISSTNPDGREESTSEGDTATVDVTIPGRWRLQNLGVSFRASRGEDTYTDVSRSIGGGQSGNVGAFRLETKSQFSRSVSLNAGFKPLPRVESKFSLQVSRDSTSYVQRIDQFSDTKRRNWKLDNRLSLWKDGSIQVNYESSFGDINLDNPRNPRNALTREDKDRKLYVEINHALTPTWKVRTYGEIRLAQGFYENAGPQGLGDSDELRQRVQLDIDGAIGPKITARVSMYARTYDQAFIDPRRSASSQNEVEYVVRPGYTYRLTPKLTVAQNYGLNSKVIDKIFRLSESTLNRNHFMNTTMDYQLTAVIRLSASYDYLLQDSGLYRSQSGRGERFFAPQARTKKDGIGMGVQFTVLPDGKLTFVSRQESTRERRTNFGARNTQTITERGNLALGLDSRLKLGELNLECHLRRNQSFNVTLNRNVFYNVDATLSYTF